MLHYWLTLPLDKRPGHLNVSRTYLMLMTTYFTVLQIDKR